MKRRNIGFLVFILAIGFAAIATTLVINGTFNLSFDNSEFPSNVVFTKAETTDGTATINGNEQNIDFDTKKLETVGDTAILEYEVTNKSQQYNASVTINCGLKDSFASFDEYFEITNDLASPFELSSAESKTGKLTIKLKKAYTESDTNVELICTLVASPISRETLGNKYIANYKDPILNGADPVLDENGKLVPVKLASDGTVTYADLEKEWYNYTNKEWANAVILVDNPSKTYEVSDIIKESDIESYFVWIPRYRYQIFDTGEYNSVIESELPPESNAKEIQIVFENSNTEESRGYEVGEWLTHTGFLAFDSNGIWVGKFETGYAGATNIIEAQHDIIDASKIIVKPNVYSWRGISVSNIFENALDYEDSLPTSLLRNTEWGAVAYLSHSKYGINDEVRINNNENALTGYAANTKGAEASTTENSAYNTETGYLASTTGNITGVYDMSGGAYEYVAGYRANKPGESGVTADYRWYSDIYDDDSSTNSYNYSVHGDATGEMGPFYEPSNDWPTLGNWYNDVSYFVSSSSPWFVRGGCAGDGPLAGQFSFFGDDGSAVSVTGFRLMLAFNRKQK